MVETNRTVEPKMQRVSSADFVRKFSAYCDAALAEPIVLTRNGRDRLMVISVERYKQLLAFAVMHAEAGDGAADSIAELDSLIRGTGTDGA